MFPSSFSTEADKVFVYFTDHGAPGLIGFPSTIVNKTMIINILYSPHSDDSQEPFGHTHGHAQEGNVQGIDILP